MQGLEAPRHAKAQCGLADTGRPIVLHKLQTVSEPGRCLSGRAFGYVQNSTVSIRSWYAQSYTSEYQPVSGMKHTKVE